MPDLPHQYKVCLYFGPLYASHLTDYLLIYSVSEPPNSKVINAKVTPKIIPDNLISSFYMNNKYFNPLNPELNPICYLLALLAHHFLYVNRIRVKLLTSRLLMSYIYMEHLFLMFLDHTQRRSTVGRSPLDE